MVLPDELDTLKIVPGEDRCTLVTCTPYGVNTHRLLVHAHRIDKPLEEYAKGIWNWVTEHIALVLIALVVFVLAILFLLRLAKDKKKKNDTAADIDAAAPPEDMPEGGHTQ